MTSTLARWLASRTEEDLAAILVNRPEAATGAPPRNLSDLAARLQTQHALAGVARELPQPCLDLAEALLVFGPLPAAKLAAIMRVDPDDPTLTACLDVLQTWVAAWEFEDQWQVSANLKSVLPAPLRLGPPVVEILVNRTVEDLRARANTLGLGGTARSKPALLEELVAFYEAGDGIRKLVASAPADQRELLVDAAWNGPTLRYDGPYLYTGRPDPAIAWLLNSGLVLSDWQRIVVPREVGLAVRGVDWHPTLTPAPAVTGRPARLKDVDHDAAAAASIATASLTATLDAVSAGPLAILRAGGIGVKEIRRLAKAVDGDESTIRLWLELAHAAGWLDVDGDTLVPTDRYDEWLGAPPTEQLAAVLAAWVDLTVVPLMTERPDGIKSPAALAPDPYGSAAAELRLDVLRALDGSPGSGFSPDDVVALVAYRRPLICRALGDPALAVAPLLAEIETLGLASRTAISSLGRALLAGTVAEAAERFVAPAAITAIFQADLTIVVTGTPSREVSALLDDVADRESHGAAVTWRCSAVSVRRALDAGRDADELITALQAIAISGRLPQPLEYLIQDVARRHGDVRVRAVGCVIRADDPAVLAEIAAHRSLASLRLAQIAPTVLTSASDSVATLEALRRAGYAPVGESADGTTLVERARRRRAPRGLDTQNWIPSGSALDPRALAAKLKAAPAVPEMPPPPPLLHAVPEPRGSTSSSTLAELRRSAGHLSEPELRLLASGLDRAHPVWISYTSAQGEATARTIEPLELAGHILVAHCYLRDDERHFVLARINEVRPD